MGHGQPERKAAEDGQHPKRKLQQQQCQHRPRDAARIGSVVDDPNRFVQMTTKLGGQRMVDWLSGEQLPRIC